MQGHDITPPIEPRLSPNAELAVLAVAVLLMFGGAVMLLAGVLSAGIAIPLITVGIALVAIEWVDKRRGH